MRTRGASAPVLVVGSSAVAGLLGFVITFLAARDLGPAATAGFTAVWSGIYVVGAALGGAQQEVARAVRPSPEGTRSRTLPIFLLGGAGLVLVVVALIAAAWTPPVFGARAPFLVAPLAITLLGGDREYWFVSIVLNLGALLALALPGDTLRLVFAVFVGVVGLRLARDGIRGDARGRR